MANKNLNAAKTAKKDEFYTQMTDIERELQHYWKHFRGKVVLCNCDDPYESNFFKYFALRFNQLGLKKLICTCYDGSPVMGSELSLFALDAEGEEKKVAYKVEITEVSDVNGDGAVDLADVEYLIKNDKKFLIVGSQKSIGCKEIFPLFKENKVWWGYGFKGAATHFYSPYEDMATAGNHIKDMIRVSGVTWFTNLEIPKRNEHMDLVCRYSPEEYPHYENYDAIEVGQTSDIPFDYDGIMGVPITFLDKYNPEQFEIIGSNSSTDLCKELGVKPLGEEWIKRYRAAGGTGHNTANMVRIVYNDAHGKPKVAFSRVFIRNKHPQTV